MKKSMRLRIVLGLYLAFVLTGMLPGVAEAAYVDPNTGGLLFQILAATFGLVSGLVLIFARRIRHGLARAARALRERSGGRADESQASGPPGD